jgi:signal transduction histidine kinase
VMARTRAQDEFIGKEVDPITKAAIAGRSGTWEGKSLDGKDIFGTYARSGLTDYRVAIGVAKADLNAPIVQSLSLFAAIGVVIAGLSTMLAFYFGARVTAPIVALSHQAASLGRGEAVQPLSTSLLEANEVGAEISRAAEALRERQADLREANDEIQRFAYIVSHDLRSPLVNIMGFTTELEALRDDMAARIAKLRAGPDAAPAILGNAPMAANVGPSDDEVFSDFDEAIGFIKASINKMDRLINAVLHLSRQGRRDFKPERIDMGAMVQGIRDSMAHQVAENGTEISVGALPAVLSDRLALEQVFSNLLDNAVKYLRPGVPGRITVAGRATPGGMVYEVRDNGRGIDAKDRERVFELFRRSGVQDRPGEGIGLAHVRSLVRRLGGQITLASEFGQGSTFTITLPRRWPGERKKDAA